MTDPSNTGAVLSLGAVLRVSRGGHYVATLRPSTGYYPATAGVIPPGQAVDSLIGATPVSQVALKSSLRRDLWASITPHGTPLPEQGVIDGADRLIKATDPPAEKLRLAYYVLKYGVLARYLKHPPPAEFTLISSPLVTWIWLGGLIVLLGGLTALWPPPSAFRGRVRARYRARVAKELGRA